MIDDGREIVRNRDFFQLAFCRVVVAGFNSASHHVGRERCDEEGQSIGAFVQGTHESLVAGNGWRLFAEVFGDLAFGKRVEHDLFATGDAGAARGAID